MDIPHLENQRLLLIKKLSTEKSPRYSIFLLYTYFDEILSLKDNAIIESFLLEFSKTYLRLIGNFTSIGIEPTISVQILDQAKQNLELNIFVENKDELNISIGRIQREIERISISLAGSKTFNTRNSELSFPVLEGGENNGNSFGLLETFTIKLEKNTSSKNNNFIIVPSSEKIEKRLIDQIEISWQLALKYLERYFRKPYKHHTVIINFNKKFVQYEGYSLGMAITLGFLQELFRFYNTPLTLEVKRNVTFSGGLNSDGNVKSLSRAIIEKKIETVFFSEILHFALPEDDLIDAQNKLIDLKKAFPQRKLKLIGVTDFDDLLNYRHILDIKKTETKVRINKFLNKNKTALGLSLILLGILIYYSFFTFDNNPYEFKVVKNTVHILNKHGNVLWSTTQNFTTDITNWNGWKSYHRNYDIDKDGTNEIILTHEFKTQNDSIKYGGISCFNNVGKQLWRYHFEDKISNKRKEYKNYFHLYMIDIIEEKNNPVIIAYAKHHLWSPSAIIKLDAKTGKRLNGTLWSQGHFSPGTVCDFDRDGDLEIIIGGINNALKSAFALSIDVSVLEGQTPNNINNLFLDIPIGKFNKYLLLNKSDISNYFDNPFNGVTVTNFSHELQQIQINVDVKHPTKRIGPVYKFKNNFTEVEIQIGDHMQFIRDSLVVKGKLNPPLTISKEYSQGLIDGIKEWNGKDFIKYKSQLE